MRRKGEKKVPETGVMRHFFFFRSFCIGGGFAIALDKARFFAGSGVFVDDAFADRRVKFDLRHANFVQRVCFAIVNGDGRALDDCARLGFDQTIARAAAGVFANFFLGGCRICQFRFLRINSSDCDTQFYLKQPRTQNQRAENRGKMGMVYNRRSHGSHYESRDDSAVARHFDGDCDAVFRNQPDFGACT